VDSKKLKISFTKAHPQKTQDSPWTQNVITAIKSLQTNMPWRNTYAGFTKYNIKQLQTQRVPHLKKIAQCLTNQNTVQTLTLNVPQL